MTDEPVVTATVTMDYVLLGYLRRWALTHQLRLVAHPTEQDSYALVVGQNHPVFPPQDPPWE
jgi:hypothetical protein